MFGSNALVSGLSKSILMLFFNVDSSVVQLVTKHVQISNYVKDIPGVVTYYGSFIRRVENNDNATHEVLIASELCIGGTVEAFAYRYQDYVKKRGIVCVSDVTSQHSLALFCLSFFMLWDGMKMHAFLCCSLLTRRLLRL